MLLDYKYIQYYNKYKGKRQKQVRKIQIQIRKYKYVFDPIPDGRTCTYTFLQKPK